MKIAVIGNDPHALVTAWLCRRARHTVYWFNTERPIFRRPYIVFESGKVSRLLRDLDLNFSPYRIKSGILLQDSVKPFPRVFRDLGKVKSAIVRKALWGKTRLLESDQHPWISIDMEADTTRIALQFSWGDFIDRIQVSKMLGMHPEFLIHPEEMTFKDGNVIRFDRCFMSLPLWKCHQYVTWPVPHASAVALNTAVVDRNAVGEARDLFSGWDYVWTPYTPDNLVHRVFQVGDDYHVQFSGEWPEGATHPGLLGDLNYLFPSGWTPLPGTERAAPGFLCPLSEKATWPDRVSPIGRLAKWDSRATLTQTIEEVLEVIT